MPTSAIDNPLVTHILGMLVEQPMHQYALRQALTARYPTMQAQFSAGSVYALIGTLVREGWIAPLRSEREQGRRSRTIYGLTAMGQKAFRQRIAAEIRATTSDMPAFVTAVAYLGALTPDEAIAALRVRRTAIDRRAEAVHHALQDADHLSVIPLHTIEGDFLAHQLASESAWIAQLIDRIETGELTWPDMPTEGRYDYSCSCQ